MMKTLLLVAASAALLYAGLVESLPNGAPAGACDTLTPLLNPMGHSEPPQTSPVPYSIDLSPFNNSGVWEYTPGTVYTRKHSVFVIHDSLADFQVHPLTNKALRLESYCDGCTMHAWRIIICTLCIIPTCRL